MTQLHEAVVPASLVGQDPLDGTMIDAVFRWTPGLPPGARTMANPMGTDDGAPDEFELISPCGLDADAEGAVIEWLDTHWDRPAEPEPDWCPADEVHRAKRRAEGVPEYDSVERAAAKVGNSFLRGLGWSVARQLVNAVAKAVR